MRTMLRSDLLIITAVLFVVITGIAMLVYPGGTFENENADHYSMSKNFFSDLGSTRTYDGRLNIFSMILFIIAMVIIALAFSLFTLNYRAVSDIKGRFVRLGKASIFFGMLCGLSFIGVAAAPVNLYPDVHLNILRAAFISLVIYMILVLILQCANGWNRMYTVLNLVYLVIVLAYFVLLLFGPGIGTSSGLETQAIAQKIVIYCTIFNMLIQAYGVRRHVIERDARDMSE